MVDHVLRLRRGRLHQRQHPQLQRRDRQRAGRALVHLRRARSGARSSRCGTRASASPFNRPQLGNLRPSALIEGDFFGSQPSPPTGVSETTYYDSPTLPDPPRLPEARRRLRRRPGRPDLRRVRLAELLLPLLAPSSWGCRIRSSRATRSSGCRAPSAPTAPSASTSRSSAGRPAQRDSQVPDFEAGLRLQRQRLEGDHHAGQRADRRRAAVDRRLGRRRASSR